MADVLPAVAPADEPAPPKSPSPIVLAAVSVAVPDLVHDAPALPVLISEANSDFSAAATDASSHNASFSSTPPTTLDAASVASDTSKLDIASALAPLEDPIERIEPTVEVGTPHRDTETPQPTTAEDKENLTPRRARAARASTGAPVYNLAKLAGTHIHGKRRANGDDVRDRRRRTMPVDALASAATGDSLEVVVQDGIHALDINWSLSAPSTPQATRDVGVKTKSKALGKTKSGKLAHVTRRATRATAVSDTVVAAATSLGKRGRKVVEKIPRELRRLRDTNEFVGIEAEPVLHTIWSNGKYIDPNDLNEDGEPLRKKVRKNAAKDKKAEIKAEPEAEVTSKEATPTVTIKQKRVKKWLDRGLYAGQDIPRDRTAGMSAADKKKLAQLPELAPTGKVNKTLPLPIFAGLRTLINGRDFKLPFDVCNPLPPGQPKPDEWRKMTKNRFVGDAGTYWRKTDHFKDYQSKCVCKPHDGCAEDCQNRIMLYECDETNCNVGKEHCQNRAFQNLQERTKKGGRFRVGVEVVKTSDRGYGVRSNRCFEPNQIIMEYTGEIITEAECERRMNEKYKDNECYYLMAFDQNMIIDATTGSIARFVNHSCSPNCRMEKWIVHGQPRMALFAGERPIMTGEELTYDYNFDPFSAKNVQKCLCGSENCRGVLGPKVSKVPKADMKSTIKETLKTAKKAGKRKLKALLDGEEAGGSATKKRKIAKATGPKKSIKTKATKVIKKTANSISVSAKSTVKAAQAKPVSVSVRKATLVQASKTLIKNGKQLLLADTIGPKASKRTAAKKKTITAKGAAKPAVKASPAKARAKATTKTPGKGSIKATIKSAGLKGSVKSTVKSAKHTVNKTAGKKTVNKTTAKKTTTTKGVAGTTKKTTVKKTSAAALKKAAAAATKTTITTTTTKASILASPDSAKVTKKYGKKDRSVIAVGGSISVKGPRKALDISREQNRIRVVTDSE